MGGIGGLDGNAVAFAVAAYEQDGHADSLWLASVSSTGDA